MSKKLKDIGIVSVLTVVSRVLGLARDSLSLAMLGTGLSQAAFATAFRVPNLFRRLLGEGALTAAFVPKLQEELRERERAGAFALVNNVASWLLLVTGSLATVAMLVCSQARLIPLAADSYVVADLMMLLFPYLAFVCVAAILSAALNVFGRFLEPALSPIWLNLAMIIGLNVLGRYFADTDAGRVKWLCAGVLVGGFLQMAVPGVVLMREGWRPRLDLRWSPAMRDIAGVMGPTIFGVAIYQINLLVVSFVAFKLSHAGASAFFYANRLMELPIGVFAIAVSTVVYPLLAKHAVEKNFTEMAHDYHKGLRLILIINVPAAVGLTLLAEPITRTLFEHGAFTAADTRLMAPLVGWFAVGLPFFSVVSLTTRAFYAVKDTFTPVKFAAVSFVINLALMFTLKGSLGITGLVLASTAAVIVQTIGLQWALTLRFPGMRFGDLWLTLGKVLLASAAMGTAVLWGWYWLLNAPGGRSGDLAAIFGLIPLAVAVYAGVLWLVRVEGREELTALMTKLRARISRGK